MVPQATRRMVAIGQACVRSRTRGVWLMRRILCTALVATGLACEVASGTLAPTETDSTGTRVSAPAAPTAVSDTTFVLMQVVRLDTNAGPARVSSGVPLPPGTLMPDQLERVALFVENEEQAIYIEALEGRHADGSLRSILVQFDYEVPIMRRLPARLEIAADIRRKLPAAEKSPIEFTYKSPLPEAAVLPMMPNYIIGTGIVGETEPAPSSAYPLYESNFTKYADPKWDLMMRQWEGGLTGNQVTTYNYYDRALIYWAWWARTGDAEYWKRAIYHLIAYREVYLRSYNYRVQPHNIQIEGLELHYLLTGDQESRNGVSKAADYYATVWLPEIGNAQARYTENRIQARTLDGLLTAARLGIRTRNHDALARQALTAILSTQNEDGSYRFRVSCNTQYNFMVGLLNDVLIKYYTYFEKDERIPAAIGKALDFMSGTQWLAGPAAFKYASETCPGAAGPNPAPDLNLLIVNGFGWYGRESGEANYRVLAETIFRSGIQHAWLGANASQAQKQLNENYRSSYRYLAYRR